MALETLRGDEGGGRFRRFARRGEEVRIFRRFVVGGAAVGEEEDFSGIRPLLMPLVLALLGSISIDQWDSIHMYRRQGSYHCCMGALCCEIFI